MKDAVDSNWVAPLGPHVDAFEQELAALVGVPHALALSSGTAALHLALVVLGVGAGDEVACSSLTFSASANPSSTSARRRCSSTATRHLDDGSGAARAGSRRAAGDPRGDRRRPLRPVLRLRPHPRALRRHGVHPDPGRGRVARRDVPRRARRRPGRPRRVLVQREQDDHDERRRHARLARRAPGSSTRGSSRRRRASPRRTTSTPRSASTTG